MFYSTSVIRTHRPAMKLDKPFVEAALSLSGFENWRPPVDVPKLHRPRHRPIELPGEGRTAAVMLLLYQTCFFRRQARYQSCVDSPS